MTTKSTKKNITRKKSKREKRLKLVIYLMIIAMFLSSVTAGLAMLL